MAKPRKTVLFIVEGCSDKTALERIFRKIYNSNREIEFRVTNGDITSDKNVTTDNVCEKINELVLEFLHVSKLNKNGIYQIIQILDMDGVFVDDSAIHKGQTSEIEYTTTTMACNNPDKIRVRNARKSAIINFLLTQKEVASRPYEMYFMSCNLDHALYNEQNLDPDKKQEYADLFYEKFIDKERVFIDFLKSDVANGVPDSFPESWKYIKKDLHSLERHSNLHIYFTQHPVM